MGERKVEMLVATTVAQTVGLIVEQWDVPTAGSLDDQTDMRSADTMAGHWDSYSAGL